MTNFERIKDMSIEELAEKLDELFACDRCPIEEFCEDTVDRGCTDTWIKWLKSEVKND